MYFDMPFSTLFSILIRKCTKIIVLMLKGMLFQLMILVLNSVLKPMLIVLDDKKFIEWIKSKRNNKPIIKQVNLEHLIEEKEEEIG
jgi:hypothetical protein